MSETYEDALRYKAVEAFKAGDYESGLESFDELVELSKHPWDQLWRGKTLHLLGRYAAACESYERVLQLVPAEPSAMYHLAHIKATCEDPAFRDGEEAVALATRVCEISNWRNWLDISVLAAAYAEVGDWERAEQFAVVALELSPEDTKTARLERVNQYRRRIQYRSSPDINRSLMFHRPRNSDAC
jgi:tetratricopeptide (TPR) repeat protein